MESKVWEYCFSLFYISLSYLNQFFAIWTMVSKIGFMTLHAIFTYKLFIPKSGELYNTNFQQRFSQHSLSDWEKKKF